MASRTSRWQVAEKRSQLFPGNLGGGLGSERGGGRGAASLPELTSNSSSASFLPGDFGLLKLLFLFLLLIFTRGYFFIAFGRWGGRLARERNTLIGCLLLSPSQRSNPQPSQQWEGAPTYGDAPTAEGSCDPAWGSGWGLPYWRGLQKSEPASVRGSSGQAGPWTEREGRQGLWEL